MLYWSQIKLAKVQASSQKMEVLGTDEKGMIIHFCIKMAGFTKGKKKNIKSLNFLIF